MRRLQRNLWIVVRAPTDLWTRRPLHYDVCVCQKATVVPGRHPTEHGIHRLHTACTPCTAYARWVQAPAGRLAVPHLAVSPPKASMGRSDQQPAVSKYES
jgi:hypothetical protein